MALVTVGSQGVFPKFFIDGVGATPSRQVVSRTALALFVILFMGFSKSKSDSLCWYSLALALIAVSLLVMKIVSPDILHKTEAGGVQLGIQSREGAKEVFVPARRSLAY